MPDGCSIASAFFVLVVCHGRHQNTAVIAALFATEFKRAIRPKASRMRHVPLKEFPLCQQLRKVQHVHNTVPQLPNTKRQRIITVRRLITMIRVKPKKPKPMLIRRVITARKRIDFRRLRRSILISEPSWIVATFLAN